MDKSLRDTLLIARREVEGYDDKADVAEALTEVVAAMYDIPRGFGMLRIFAYIIGIREIPETDDKTSLDVAGG